MRMQSDIRTVLFTDVCETGVFGLDDVEGHKLAARALRLVSEAAKRNGGKVVKTVRNCIVVTFTAVESAHRAARIIQLALRNGPVRVKCGMHVGAVITTNDDIFGDTVKVAEHVLAHAGAGEILMTAKCVEALPAAQRASVRLVDTTSIAGLPEWIELHRVLSDVEAAAPAQAPADETPVALVLTYKGSSMRIAAGDEPFAMGREASCSLRLASALASRNHATICWRDGRFVLMDSSGNGTYVIDGSGEELHISRREHVLQGHGRLSLGMHCEGNTRDIIEYRCELAPAAGAKAGTLEARPELSLVADESVAQAPVTAFAVPNRHIDSAAVV